MSKKKVWVMLLCMSMALCACGEKNVGNNTSDMQDAESDADENGVSVDEEPAATETLMPYEAAQDTVEASAVVKDAILYRIDQDLLYYNVTYSAWLNNAVIKDTTGLGIETLSALNAMLGMDDEPMEALSAESAPRMLGNAVTADLQFNLANEIVGITIKEIVQRPVIGISWKKDEIGDDYKKYAEILERNGAIAVYLPAVTDAASAREILSKLDGVFFTGGTDYHPSLFDQEITPHGARDINTPRDISDIHMMQQAVAMDIPLLAVCRGEQGLNVALGGGLIQDIPYYLGQQVLNGAISENRVTNVLSGTMPGSSHTVVSEDCDGSHLRVHVDGIDHSLDSAYHPLVPGEDGIGIAEDSKWLYPMFGTTQLTIVSTAHHQAVDPYDLGDGVSVAAISSDGIVEAIECKDNLFVLGLQWHPERDALEDTRGVDVSQDESNIPIREFVKHAVIYATR